jgi:hypothetical protein
MTATPATRQGLLAARFTPERVHTALLPREQWQPYGRTGWEKIPAATRARMLARAEQRLGMAWPELPATRFLDFVRDGNRSRYEAHHFERRYALCELVLGERIEGQGRFLDDIINGIWALCEESFWGVSAHSFSPRFGVQSPNSRYPSAGLPDTAYPVVDLFAAETGALLAWTHYLVGAQIAATLPVVTDRIEREIEARVLQPYRAIDDWWWFGKHGDRPVNNWNPWINSNVLATNLLIEPDTAVREQTVLRAIESVDLFLDGYHPDGGCDEGTSYWGRAGASLYDCLDLLSSASGGQLDAFDIPLVQEIGRYIYRMHIGGRWFVNFADGAAQVSLDGPIVYQYGRRIGDPKMAAQGAVAWREQAERLPGSGSIGRALRDLAIEPEIAAADATPPLIAQAWLPGTEILTAREREGSTDGLFLAVKGGHNAESHNHNDVGSFIVALDGAPVIIDAGVGVYTRQTFSAERYTIWTMQSAYHNLPLIDGHQQAPGREYHARDVHADITPEHAALTLDIAGAYPAEVGLRRWERTVRLERGANPRIVLDDRYDLDHQPQTLALHLLVAGLVDTTAPGVLRCAGAQRALAVHYDPDVFTATAETITIDDARLGGVWGECIGRIILAVRQPQAQGGWSLTMTA